MSYPSYDDPLSALLRPWEGDERRCVPWSLRVTWDQWAVAVFECPHGSYKGVSRGQQDMFSAVRAAHRKFQVEHEMHTSTVS